MSNEPKHRNEVHLAGLLVKDPTIRYTASGKQVATLSLVTKFKDKAEFHRVVLWEALAQTSESLHKGDFVRIVGRLATRSWEDAAKVKHYSTEVVAFQIALPSDDPKPLTPDETNGTNVARAIL